MPAAVVGGCTAGATPPTVASARPTEVQDAIIATYGFGLRAWPVTTRADTVRNLVGG